MECMGQIAKIRKNSSEDECRLELVVSMNLDSKSDDKYDARHRAFIYINDTLKNVQLYIPWKTLKFYGSLYTAVFNEWDRQFQPDNLEMSKVIFLNLNADDNKTVRYSLSANIKGDQQEIVNKLEKAGYVINNEDKYSSK